MRRQSEQTKRVMLGAKGEIQRTRNRFFHSLAASNLWRRREQGPFSRYYIEEKQVGFAELQRQKARWSIDGRRLVLRVDGGPQRRCQQDPIGWRFCDHFWQLLPQSRGGHRLMFGNELRHQCHPRQLSPFPERLVLPCSHDEILFG